MEDRNEQGKVHSTNERQTLTQKKKPFPENNYKSFSVKSDPRNEWFEDTFVGLWLETIESLEKIDLFG